MRNSARGHPNSSQSMRTRGKKPPLSRRREESLKENDKGKRRKQEGITHYAKRYFAACSTWSSANEAIV